MCDNAMTSLNGNGSEMLAVWCQAYSDDTPIKPFPKTKLIILIHLISVERFGRMVTRSTVEPTQNSDKCSRFVA